MALSERTRHEVYEHAKRTWTEEAAEALMELLPPVGWADVATKGDIAALERRIDSLEGRFATKEDLHREINRLILWFVPLNIGLAVTVARLAG